uniref:Uncharacterized protein LOC113797685 n=1 Tax=Dermatophagoides pteronyssinus TaxID=6956 RepID=A0A6P6YF83_DERPT|nr:uncharacterized protein LOC113797685 [Dermatophagoides pteronyssinus]
MTDNEESIRFFKPKVILFNIIGTILPINWQDECLKPFINNNIRRFIEENWLDSEFVYDMITIQFQHESFEQYFDNNQKDCPLILNFDRDHSNWMDVIDSCEKFIHWQINNHITMSDSTLELLRLCWMDGYRKGLIKTKLFPDAKTNLNRWKSMNIQLGLLTLNTMNKDVCRLILSSTDDGNISDLFDYYIDEQSIGSNRTKDIEFWKKIMELMKITNGSEILLISHQGRELKMAKEKANFQTLLLLRPSVVEFQSQPRSYYLIRFSHTDRLEKIKFV